MRTILPLGLIFCLISLSLAQNSDSPLIDTHNSFPWQVWKNAGGDLQKLDLRQSPTAPDRTSIQRLRGNGVGAVFWSVYIPSSMPGKEALRTGMEEMDIVDQILTRYPDTFQSAATADDVDHISRAGKIATLIAIEGDSILDGSLGILRMLYKLGVRSLTPANEHCDSPSPHKGLNPFSESVVHEMNWLGMLVDLSHASTEAVLDTLRLAKAPVIFSHAGGCQDIPDEVLRKLRDNGGIVAVPAGPGASDKIDHIRQVAGIDHVGLGSDWDSPEAAKRGNEDTSTFRDLGTQLTSRGYSADDIRKIRGLNLLRVMREVERVSDKLHGRE